MSFDNTATQCTKHLCLFLPKKVSPESSHEEMINKSGVQTIFLDKSEFFKNIKCHKTKGVEKLFWIRADQEHSKWVIFISPGPRNFKGYTEIYLGQFECTKTTHRKEILSYDVKFLRYVNGLMVIQNNVH